MRENSISRETVLEYLQRVVLKTKEDNR